MCLGALNKKKRSVSLAVHIRIWHDTDMYPCGARARINA